jgi:hypothetical protein
MVFNPLGQFGQKPEPSQTTGMALVRCILGKFLGVVCHCFPPCLDVPTFAARCLYVRNEARDPSSERWNYGREMSGNYYYYYSALGLVWAGTGMALVRCILDKFLEVVCHCFLPRLYVPTFAAR